VVLTQSPSWVRNCRRLRLISEAARPVWRCDFARVDIRGAGSLGGQGTGSWIEASMYWPAPVITVIHRRRDGHIGKMAADVPGIATAWRHGGAMARPAGHSHSRTSGHRRRVATSRQIKNPARAVCPKGVKEHTMRRGLRDDSTSPTPGPGLANTREDRSRAEYPRWARDAQQGLASDAPD
jgi:hypothetical protein